MAYQGQGWNPVHGADGGAPPPGTGNRRFAPPPQAAQYGWYPPQPVVYQPGVPVWPGPLVPVAPQNFPSPTQVYQPYPVVYGPPPGAPTFPYPAGPPVNNEIPGVHFRNHTGGVGIPPGYNYLFPAEHAMIHVLNKKGTKTSPWTTNSYFAGDNTVTKHVVPVNTSTGDLLARLGVGKDDMGKTVLWEVMETGNGTWRHGMKFEGDSKDKMKKAISEWGWNGKRTGLPGQQPVVWLWLEEKAKK